MKANRATIYHSLAMMLEAGLPLTRALQTTVSSARGKLRRAFAAVERSVVDGDTMAEAFGEHPRAFNPLDVLLVDAGETSGRLAECLHMLSNWYAFCDSRRRQFISGVMLSIVIFHAAVLISPLPAVFLQGLDTYGYLRKVLGMVVVPYSVVAAILAVVYLTPKTGLLRRLLDRVVMMIPLLRSGVRHLALSRYFRVFSMLQRTGAPIARSVELAAQVGGNSVVMDLVRGGADSAEAGRAVSEGFSPGLDSEYLESWRIGEQTGMLEKTAARLADIAGDRSERIFTEMCKWTPRLIYVGVCLMIIRQIFAGLSIIQSATGLSGL